MKSPAISLLAVVLVVSVLAGGAPSVAATSGRGSGRHRNKVARTPTIQDGPTAAIMVDDSEYGAQAKKMSSKASTTTEYSTLKKELARSTCRVAGRTRRADDAPNLADYSNQP